MKISNSSNYLSKASDTQIVDARRAVATGKKNISAMDYVRSRKLETDIATNKPYLKTAQEVKNKANNQIQILNFLNSKLNAIYKSLEEFKSSGTGADGGRDTLVAKQVVADVNAYVAAVTKFGFDAAAPEAKTIDAGFTVNLDTVKLDPNTQFAAGTVDSILNGSRHLIDNNAGVTCVDNDIRDIKAHLDVTSALISNQISVIRNVADITEVKGAELANRLDNFAGELSSIVDADVPEEFGNIQDANMKKSSIANVSTAVSVADVQRLREAISDMKRILMG